MALSDNTYDNIQQYLDREMKPEERRRFEQAMEQDEALAQEVALQADMQELLADSPENELRHSLLVLGRQATDREKGGIVRLLWLLLPFVALTAWWILSNSKSKPSERERVRIENSAPAPVEPGEEERQLEVEDTSTQEEAIPTAAPKKKPVTSEPSKPAQQPSKKNPPIAANYGPSPSLEFLINNNLRSDDFQWVSTPSQEDITLSTSDDSFSFQVAGRLKSTANLSAKDFKLHLFSNEPAAFENFQPLRTYGLSLQKVSEKVYRFDFQQDIALKPGLYYYLIEDYDTEQIYQVEKFAVRLEE